YSKLYWSQKHSIGRISWPAPSKRMLFKQTISCHQKHIKQPIIVVIDKLCRDTVCRKISWNPAIEHRLPLTQIELIRRTYVSNKEVCKSILVEISCCDRK